MITIPKIEVDIITLTPIWTGNKDRDMKGVKETGILGSLRWWYEAILRGFGCEVCDPTESKCNYNVKEFQKTGIASDGFYKDGRVCVCPACQIFGCTGWAKQFRMRWYDDKKDKFVLQNPSSGTYKHDKYKDKGYYIVSTEKGKDHGKCKAVFYPQNRKVGEILTYLLKFASRWGGFGARPQFGYGICDANTKREYTPKIGKPEHSNSSSNRILPDLRDFFFCKFEHNLPDPLKAKNCSIDSINYPVIEIKYQIRQALHIFSPDIRHFICGLTDEKDESKKNSSKIFISRVHNKIQIIRGYVPQECIYKNYNPQSIVYTIFDTLGGTSLPGEKKVWIEFDPDHTKGRLSSPFAYRGSTDEEKYGEWLEYLIAEEGEKS